MSDNVDASLPQPSPPSKFVVTLTSQNQKTVPACNYTSANSKAIDTTNTMNIIVNKNKAGNNSSNIIMSNNTVNINTVTSEVAKAVGEAGVIVEVPPIESTSLSSRSMPEKLSKSPEQELEEPHSRSSSSMSSSSSSSSSLYSGTPPLAPRTAPVPLITPRYQRRSRTNRHMDVTDSFPTHMTPSEALITQSTETMTITNGPLEYDQVVHFHTYDVYKQGKHHIHSRSVGYSSEGDLVMTREDYSEPSDVDNGFIRRRTTISEPTVLDPTARRPLSEKERHTKRVIRINRPRYKKYPGIHVPRNRKVRNRLMNDYFANEYARAILEQARLRRGGAEVNHIMSLEGEVDLPRNKQSECVMVCDSPPLRPMFRPLPRRVQDSFALSCDKFASKGSLHTCSSRHMTQHIRRDPDAGETRFHLLNSRLKGELQHALCSAYLTSEIEDLECAFRQYIRHGPTEESLVFYFRDGYGRLVCHGVAAYYQLNSHSQFVEPTRSVDDNTSNDESKAIKLTYVTLPRQRKAKSKKIHLPHTTLLQVLRHHRGADVNDLASDDSKGNVNNNNKDINEDKESTHKNNTDKVCNSSSNNGESNKKTKCNCLEIMEECLENKAETDETKANKEECTKRENGEAYVSSSSPSSESVSYVSDLEDEFVMVDPMSPLDLNMDYDTLAAVRKTNNLRPVHKKADDKLADDESDDEVESLSSSTADDDDFTEQEEKESKRWEKEQNQDVENKQQLQREQKQESENNIEADKGNEEMIERELEPLHIKKRNSTIYMTVNGKFSTDVNTLRIYVPQMHVKKCCKIEEDETYKKV